jgi:hypothetical protein
LDVVHSRVVVVDNASTAVIWVSAVERSGSKQDRLVGTFEELLTGSEQLRCGDGGRGLQLPKVESREEQ